MSKKEDFLKETINLWQPEYSSELTSEQAEEIVNNVTKFLDTLLSWQRPKKHQGVNKE